MTPPLNNQGTRFPAMQFFMGEPYNEKGKKTLLRNLVKEHSLYNLHSKLLKMV